MSAARIADLLILLSAGLVLAWAVWERLPNLFFS